MIHLAKEDVGHSLGKFTITAMGVGMLLGIVLIMMGVYRGMIVDAETLLNDVDVDLWIVQEGTLGPFAEASRVHEDLQYAVASRQGIDRCGVITFQNIQIPKKNRKIRVFAVGYDVYGSINPINPHSLIAGRALASDHYEIVVTDKTGFLLNDRIRIGRHFYTVVGLTHGTVSSGGDLLVYISLKDAQELQFSYSNKRIQTDRARGILKHDIHMVNAVVATVLPGFSAEKVAGEIREWQHKSVYTRQQQWAVLAKYVVEKASKQIGMFTAILVVVSTIIIALIIYTMTLEKMKEIAIMKLMGLPNRMIVSMIVEETLWLGILAFIFGNIFSHAIYAKFPKRVVLEIPDAWMLFGVVVVASILASFIAVKKVVNADPAAAIGG